MTTTAETNILMQLRALKIKKEALEVEIAEIEADIAALEALQSLALREKESAYDRRTVIIDALLHFDNFGGVEEIAAQEIILVQADLTVAENDLADLIATGASLAFVSEAQVRVANLEILLIRANNGVQIPGYWDTASDVYSGIHSDLEDELAEINLLFSQADLDQMNDLEIEINALKVLL